MAPPVRKISSSPQPGDYAKAWPEEDSGKDYLAAVITFVVCGAFLLVFGFLLWNIYADIEALWGYAGARFAWHLSALFLLVAIAVALYRLVKEA